MSRKRKSDKVLANTLEQALALIPSLPEGDYNWAAGFIEGDGCIHVGMGKEGREGRRSTRFRYHVILHALQKDPRPLRILMSMFGGTIRPARSGGRRYNQWTICANRAYAALTLIEPFLRVKREQAKLAMALQRNINEHRIAFNKWNTLSPEASFFRQQIYARCRFLNSKEYISSLNTASGEFGEQLRMLESIPSEATPGLFVGVERVTAREVTPKNNLPQERPTCIPKQDEIA